MKKFIIVISILALALGLFAEQITIGTESTSQRHPLASRYGYHRSAALYKAEEIVDQNIRITSVAWYSQMATTAAVPTKIYMKTTSASTLNTCTWANMISGASLLYDQTQTGTVASDWNTITLGSGFDLDQGQNLLILVERNFGGTGSGAAGGDATHGPQIHATWVTTSDDIHRTWENDVSPPTGLDDGAPVLNSLRPNVRLSYTVNAPLDELFIGTGTEIRRHPLGSVFGYERNAALYTAAEIGAQNISIATVSWYSTLATSAAVPTKIYLKTTTASTLTRTTWANMISGATLLYDQTRAGTVEDDWNIFALSSGFDLGVGESLIVMVERNYGGHGSGPSGGGNDGGGIRSSSCNNADLFWAGDVPPTDIPQGFYSVRPNVKLSYTVIPEELVIGEGESVQRFPLCSYYGYERSAALYTADEIGAGNISISTVAWYATLSTTAAVPTKIYLKRTSASTLTTSSWAYMISDASLLFNAPKTGTIANAWNAFTLNNTFDLGMGENLIVMVERNYGGYGASTPGGGSAGGGIRSTLKSDTHLTWWGDTSAHTGNNLDAPGLRPNLKLYYENNTVYPRVLPFTEDWANGNFAYNEWTTESENWGTISNLGSPAPSARFNYSPHLADYSSALSSYDFDARGENSVEFSFDLFLDNDNDSIENVMSWQIWNGNTWITLGSYSSLNGDLPWTHYSYNISAHASNRIFKIRYLASGAQTFHINKWLIDNIHLGTPSIGVTGINIKRVGTDIVLNWTAVPGAAWYRIYSSTIPNGGFSPRTPVALTPSVTIPISSLPGNKYFFKVTSGTGAMPSGPRLDNAPVSSPNLRSEPKLNKSKPSRE